MIIGLALAAYCAFVGLFLYRPYLAFPAVVFFIPFERIGSLPLTPSGRPVVRIVQIVIAAMITASVIRWVIGRIKIPPLSKLLLLLGVFTITAGISAYLPHYSQLWSSYAALLLLVGFVATSALTYDKKTEDLAYWALLVSATIVCLFGLYQFAGELIGISPQWTQLLPQYGKVVLGFPRIQSTAQEPLYFANYLIIPLFVIGYRWLSSNLSRAWLELSVLTLVALCLLLTASRGAFLAIGIAGVIAAILFRPAVSNKRARELALSTTAVLVLTCGLVMASSRITNNDWLVAPKYFLELSTSQLEKSISFTDRSYTRGLALNVWRQHPILGVGIGGIGPYLHNYPSAYTQETSVSLNIQSLELLAEVGIMGVICYYLFIAGLVVRGWLYQRKNWIIASLSVALIAVTIQAQSYSGFLIAQNWVLAAWLLAALRLYYKNKPNAGQEV